MEGSIDAEAYFNIKGRIDTEDFTEGVAFPTPTPTKEMQKLLPISPIADSDAKAFIGPKDIDIFTCIIMT